MKDLWSSPPRTGVKGNWKSPARAVVRYLAHQGISDGKISMKTGIPKSTIRYIRLDISNRRPHKIKGFHKEIMSSREIRRVIRFVSTNYSTRRLTFKQVKAQLGIEASARTIRRMLRKEGYKRCIACARPYTNPDQEKRRLKYAYSHK